MNNDNANCQTGNPSVIFEYRNENKENRIRFVSRERISNPLSPIYKIDKHEQTSDYDRRVVIVNRNLSIRKRVVCEISRETRGNREARRESGTRERERESRGSDSRRERSEVSGAHHKTTIIRVRAGNRDASPSPRGSQLSRFSRFERARVDVTVKPDRQFFFVDARQPGDISRSLSRDLYHRFFPFFFFFFYVVGDTKKLDPSSSKEQIYKFFDQCRCIKVISCKINNSLWR